MMRILAYLLPLLLLLSMSMNSFAMAAMQEINMIEDKPAMVNMHMEHCDEEKVAMDAACMDHCAALYALLDPYTFVFLDLPDTGYFGFFQNSPNTRPYFHWRPPGSDS